MDPTTNPTINLPTISVQEISQPALSAAAMLLSRTSTPRLLFVWTHHAVYDGFFPNYSSNSSKTYITVSRQHLFKPSSNHVRGSSEEGSHERRDVLEQYLTDWTLAKFPTITPPLPALPPRRNTLHGGPNESVLEDHGFSTWQPKLAGTKNATPHHNH